MYANPDGALGGTHVECAKGMFRPRLRRYVTYPSEASLKLTNEWESCY